MTPTGTNVLYALVALLVGYGSVLLIFLWKLIHSELPGDRSPITAPSAGSLERGLGGDAGGPLEALSSGVSTTSSTPGPEPRPFSDPGAAA